MRTLLIDNYDSFTYNLKALLESQGCKVQVQRNDEIDFEKVEAFDLLVFSPGPGIPSEAGAMIDLIKIFSGRKPMLGICLGMQAMAEVFGAALKLQKQPLHGIAKEISHFGDPIFSRIISPFKAGRYHSWVVDQKTLPDTLKVLAKSENEIMAIRHAIYRIYGFQFHPESILTDEGEKLIRNFLFLLKTVQNEKITEQTF